MNASDHPHGGGRGKSKGNVHPVSPWGQPVSFQILYVSDTMVMLTMGVGQIRLQDEKEAQCQQVCCPRKTSEPGQETSEEVDASPRRMHSVCGYCKLRHSSVQIDHTNGTSLSNPPRAPKHQQWLLAENLTKIQEHSAPTSHAPPPLRSHNRDFKSNPTAT
jgi:hypothetical protein